MTDQGTRRLVFYASATEEEVAAALDELDDATGYPLDLSVTEDPDHWYYLATLLPQGDDREVARDLLLLQRLEEHGDDLSVVRPVTHQARFADRTQAAGFERWCTSGGFRVEDVDDDGDEPRPIVVRFAHDVAPLRPTIARTTALLRKKTVELGGGYVGWVTRLVSASRP